MPKLTREEIDARTSLAVIKVGKLDKLAAKDPDAALREADGIYDPSLRASGLIAVAKRIKSIEPLQDALQILVGTPGIPGATKNRKLSQIAFAAVGVDNRFATEATEAITAPRYNLETKQGLSMAMGGSIKKILRGSNPGQLNDYPDFVVASFFESVGDRTYFGEPVNPWQSIWRYGKDRLDPITDGCLAISAFRENPEYSSRMLHFVAGHLPGQE